jgi:hypothetical protein
MFTFKPNFKIVHMIKYHFFGGVGFDLIMDVFVMVCIIIFLAKHIYIYIMSTVMYENNFPFLIKNDISRI